MIVSLLDSISINQFNILKICSVYNISKKSEEFNNIYNLCDVY